MTHPVALVALAGTLALHTLLLERVWAADGKNPWLGYALDGINIAAIALLWLAYTWAGFETAVALSAGMLTALATYGVNKGAVAWLGRTRARPMVWLSLVAWVLMVAIVSSRVSSLLGRLVAAAQPVG